MSTVIKDDLYREMNHGIIERPLYIAFVRQPNVY